MSNAITDTTTLNNGVEMPWFGLGVWQVEGGSTESVVRMALDAGYRSIDTAKAYNNEEGVGRAVRASGIPRDKLFVTTKLWNGDQGYDTALAAFDASLERLGLEYVDLYLIHWPVQGKFKDSWRALEEIYDSGRARAIGVSNFNNHHLEELLEEARVTPAVNQMEFHPFLQIPDAVAFCADLGIQFEAWRPLRCRGQGAGTRSHRQEAQEVGGSSYTALDSSAWHRGNPQVGPPRAHHRECCPLRLYT
jgi:diketogulonate reductase-like aldo/keto reductase